MMNYFQQHRDIIAKLFKIVGGIICSVSIVFLIAWQVCSMMDITYDARIKLSKFFFIGGLCIYEIGKIIAKMVPGQIKAERNRMLIAISLLMCTTVAAGIYIILGLSAKNMLLLISLFIGYIIGYGLGQNDEEKKPEELNDFKSLAKENN